MARFRTKPPDDGALPWVLAWALSLLLGFQAAYLIMKI